MSVQLTEDAPTAQRDIALCRSTLYETLSLAFYQPTVDTLHTLRSLQSQGVIEASCLLDASDPNIDPESFDSFEEPCQLDLTGRASAWAKVTSDLSLESFESLHSRMFGHTARGLVCPYETEYGHKELFQQTQQLANLSGLYSVFGLKPRVEERERSDHISCELEFAAFLTLKEAYALEQRDDAMAEASIGVTKLFLREDLGRFGRALGFQLEKHDPEGFLGNTGALLSEFLRFECRRLGVQIGSPHLSLRSTEDDQVPMACSTGSDLVQLEG